MAFNPDRAVPRSGGFNPDRAVLRPTDYEREAQDPSIGMSAGEAALVGVGSGMARMGRGVKALWNLATGDSAEYQRIIKEQEESNRRMQHLKDRYPMATGAGELTGEMAAGLPFGGASGTLAGIGAKKAGLSALGQRAAAGGAAGLVEGGIVGAPEEQATMGVVAGGGIGAASEAILPPLFRAARKYLRGLGRQEFDVNITYDSAGNPQPTPELSAALERQGVTWDQLINDPELQADIKAGSPEEASRLAMFREQGIEPAAPSRISEQNNLRDQQVENYYLRKTDDAKADELRASFLRENEAVKARFEQIANELGVPQEAGESVKDAIQGSKSSLSSARRNAYERLGQLADEYGFNVPINQQGIIDATAIANEYPIPDSVKNSVGKAMLDFGFGTDGMEPTLSILDQIVGRQTPEELTVKNLEKFRQRINNAFKGQHDAASNAARANIIDAIDSELDILASLEGASGKTAGLRDQAAHARSLRRQEAVDFQAKDLVANLIDTKPGTSTPLIDAAEVAPKLARTNKLGEYNKVISMLENGGVDGKTALGNLQAAVVMDILGSSLKHGFRLGPDRVPLVSGTQLTKALNRFGRDKLKRLFRSNPEALRNLNQIEKINMRRMTEESGVQKGSLPPALMNSLWNSLAEGASRVPMARSIEGVMKGQATRVGERRAEKIVGTIKPTSKELEDFLIFNSPMVTNIFSGSIRSAPAVTAASQATEREY